MKKTLSLALILAMLAGTLSLAACDSGKEEEPNGSTTTAGTTTSSATTTTSATSTTPEDPDDPIILPPTEEDQAEDPVAVGWEAVLQAVGSGVNLMPDYFGAISEYTVAQGYDWNPDEHPDLGNETPPNLFTNPDNSLNFSEDGTKGLDDKWCCGANEVEGCSAIIWSMTQSVTATHYAFKTANDNEEWPNRNPEAWRIYGTNADLTEDMQPTEDQLFNMEVPDGWELIDTVYETDLPDMNYTVCAFAIDNPTAYKHYMVCIDYIALGGQTFQLAEIFLFGSAD
ncbi:MAG: hypothetical protein ACI3XR_00970 [Eubacteriales bacterium]